MSDITMKIIIFGSMGLGFLFGQNMASTITMGVIGWIIVVLISYLKRKNNLIYKLIGVDILSY
ncbi:MAG: hypothetical protein KBI16_02435 [Clostridia bacterium]|nr:hypothetical protein [Clostridia bacterium]